MIACRKKNKSFHFSPSHLASSFLGFVQSLNFAFFPAGIPVYFFRSHIFPQYPLQSLENYFFLFLLFQGAGKKNLLLRYAFFYHILSPKLLFPYLKWKYISRFFRCHPNLRFCPGPNCPIVIKAAECVSKNTVCSHCKSRQHFLKS